MSLNDRCGEAAEILKHGGTLPDTSALRGALIEWLEEGKDGVRFPPREFIYAILDAPENARLRNMTSDGMWFGPNDPQHTNEEVCACGHDTWAHRAHYIGADTLRTLLECVQCTCKEFTRA